MTDYCPDFLKHIGDGIKTKCNIHYVISSDVSDFMSKNYIKNLFKSMDIPFTFFDTCSVEDTNPFVKKMVGHYNKNIIDIETRDYYFRHSKFTRAALLITYFILWCRCRDLHPGENIMIWEDSVILNSGIPYNEYINIVNSFPQHYDMILLGHFPQKFKIEYPDDGKSRLKCYIPVVGHHVCSQYLLKLNYGFTSGVVLYSHGSINKLIKSFETMIAEPITYPIECFIANNMCKMDVYCTNPSLFGQLLGHDSIVMSSR